MALVIVDTIINAPINRVFDLARSIDAHTVTTSKTKEKAVAGTTTGLIGLNEEVTFEATHFCVSQQLRARVTEYDRPNIFADQMISGAFKSMKHIHRFEEKENGVVMTDELNFKAPLGMLGIIAEKLFLIRYMRNFVIERGNQLKEMAETDAWKQYLSEKDNA